jgi:hypothetical protein
MAGRNRELITLQSDIYLEGLKKHKKFVRIVGVQVKTQTGYLLNISLECYYLNQLAW